MPTPPFYATATPPGQLTTIGSSEKILVTDVTSDTLTFTRAQTPTSAKEIDAGWIVANAMYVDDVMKSNIVLDEALSGTVNGSNKVFTTGTPFSNIQVHKNGVTLHLTDDYTITDDNEITFVTAPLTGSKLTATYITGSQVMITGSNSLITDEAPTGAVNGSNTAYTTARGYVGGSLEVFVNGVKQQRGVHFTETTPSTGIFTMSDAPLTGDNILVNYQYAATVSGNADTVDGYHANATPTANNIPVLNSRGQTGEWYEEIGRTTLSSPANALAVSSLPNYRYLKVIVSTIPVSGVTSSPFLRFNGDTANNYSRRVSAEGGADGTGASVSGIFVSGSDGAFQHYATLEVVSIASQEKLVFGSSTNSNSAGAANIPRRSTFVGKWANTTNPITSVDLFNISTGNGNFAAGSELIVLGHN